MCACTPREFSSFNPSYSGRITTLPTSAKAFLQKLQLLWTGLHLLNKLCFEFSVQNADEHATFSHPCKKLGEQFWDPFTGPGDTKGQVPASILFYPPLWDQQLDVSVSQGKWMSGKP